jgi:hypothetical protein
MRTEMDAYESNPTMWTWIRMVGRDVLSALVGVVIGSLVTLRIEIWNSIRQLPFHWTISVGVGVMAVALFLVALAIFRRKRPELTPASTRIIQTNGKYLVRIGVKNTGKGKAFDTRIKALVWSCSGKCTPFVVPASNGNPISTNVSEQIELCLPKEPVFIAISFTYRSRPNGKRKSQRLSFYYKWNGVDAALFHASIEERKLIERVRVGFTRLGKQAEMRCSYLSDISAHGLPTSSTASATPALSSPGQRVAA